MKARATFWIDDQAVFLAVSRTVVIGAPFEHCRIIEGITTFPWIAGATTIRFGFRATDTIVPETGRASLPTNRTNALISGPTFWIA
jgi:hypothetical protein